MTDTPDYTRADVHALQGEIRRLTAALDNLQSSMRMFAPRHEVDEAIRDKVNSLDAKVQQSIADSAHAANAALTAALTADDTARDAKRHLDRVRAYQSAKRRLLAAAFLIGLVAGAAVTDWHVHVAHIAALEARLPAGVATSQLWPLSPRPDQPYLVGPVAVSAALIVAAVLAWSAWRKPAGSGFHVRRVGD